LIPLALPVLFVNKRATPDTAYTAVNVIRQGDQADDEEGEEESDNNSGLGYKKSGAKRRKISAMGAFFAEKRKGKRGSAVPKQAELFTQWNERKEKDDEDKTQQRKYQEIRESTVYYNPLGRLVNPPPSQAGRGFHEEQVQFFYLFG
jgi:hypothetical protein